MKDNRIQFLKELYDKYGDYHVNYINQLKILPDGECERWSAWKLYSRCSESELKQVNLRGLMANEIMFDIEDDNIYKKFMDKVKETGLILNGGVWKTNSRGYHVPVYFNDLFSYTGDRLTAARKYVINLYGADPLKQSGLIALENVPHFKKGRIKEMIISPIDGDNKLPDIPEPKEIIFDYLSDDEEIERSEFFDNYIVVNKLTKENTRKNDVLIKNIACYYRNVPKGYQKGKSITIFQGHNPSEFDGWWKKINLKYNHGEMIKWVREFYPELEQYLRPKEEIKDDIEHPRGNRLISVFAKDVGKSIKNKDKLFYRNQSKEVVEVIRNVIKSDEKLYEGFSSIKPNRFITLIEEFTNPYIYVKDKEEKFVKKQKSISSELANTTLSSDIFQKSLKPITRMFSVPLPIMYNGELTFPKKRYDSRFNSWLTEDSPDISNTNMSLEEAKKIIHDVFHEFCFKSKQDATNSVAALLTPYLKGLFPSFNTRCPIFFYTANRERSGKDYLAGITGIVYEGNNVSEPPISSDGNNSDSANELRKKILSVLLSGRRRLHFANNKGNINNSTLEEVATASTWSDRPLGRTETLTFDNELDISLSGNVGIKYTPDLANRCIFISLHLAMEDANKRKFQNPNLHGWVVKNRDKIISALYCLVKNWIDTGSKDGSIQFASFPEWARVCGGIMESAGYMNPCVNNSEGLMEYADSATTDMKTLFELCYSKYPEQFIERHKIQDIIEDRENDIFNYLNFLVDGSGKTKFWLNFRKYIGREFSNIYLIVDNIGTRTTRQQFKFTKENIQSKLQEDML